jgi:hypothetical protein
VTFAVADEAPTAPMVTDYDKAHLKLYLRLLDANAEGAAWEQVARLLLDIDPVAERDRALRRHESHLARARWMTERGYLDLLKRGL